MNQVSHHIVAIIPTIYKIKSLQTKNKTTGKLEDENQLAD